MPTSVERSIYLDSSAIVKLVHDEEETAALRGYLASAAAHRASANVARVEVVRAVRDGGQPAVANARRVLEGLELIQLDDELLDLAGELAPSLRSLDAIHLAAALELGDELECVITYDARMTRAAGLLGLPTAAPVDVGSQGVA